MKEKSIQGTCFHFVLYSKMMMSTFVCSPDKVGEADSMFLTQTETCSWLEEFDSEYQFNAPENNLNFEQVSPFYSCLNLLWRLFL